MSELVLHMAIVTLFLLYTAQLLVNTVMTWVMMIRRMGRYHLFRAAFPNYALWLGFVSSKTSCILCTEQTWYCPTSVYMEDWNGAFPSPISPVPLTPWYLIHNLLNWMQGEWILKYVRRGGYSLWAFISSSTMPCFDNISTSPLGLLEILVGPSNRNAPLGKENVDLSPSAKRIFKVSLCVLF